MNEVFKHAVDRLFARLGVRATYHLQDSDDMITLNVILKIPDHIVDFGEAHVHTSTQVIDIKCSDIAKPRVGDVIDVNQSTYRIQGEPVRDHLNVVWKLNVVKICN